MSEKNVPPSIVDYMINLKRKNNPTRLDAINELINWVPIERKLRKKLKRTINAAGKPAYPSLVMFKALILQNMYDLSDVELEEQLRDRMSFLRFVGLGMTDDIPDSTTLCRFRNELLGQEATEKLYQMVLKQLLPHGKLKHGVSVDATIIDSSRRPRKVLEIIPEDRKEEEAGEQAAVTYSDDADAAWVQKGKRVSYGYKVHMGACPETGLILGGHVTPANKSDMNELGQVLSEIPVEVTGRCYADKGYTSKANREKVKQHGLKDGIMSKAVRGRKLTEREQIRNKLISRKRCGIERIFGTLKRGLHYVRSRYVGIAKVGQEFLLRALAYNLIRASNLYSL